MFSKLFNRKKQETEANDILLPGGDNWAFLGADMHSHFIPGIDDGAKTIEDSMLLLRAMKDMGYKTIITTPHVMSDFYPNSTATIQAGLQTVQNALKENDIDLSIKAAAEYYIDEYFVKLLETEPLLTLYEKEVLVEFSMLSEPMMLFDVIFKIQSAGYKPVIAHPERYIFFHNNFAKYKLLKDRGCLFQLNILAIAGYYGKHIKETAVDLLHKGMYDYCGSDMHHEKHASTLKAMAGGSGYQMLVAYPFLNSRLCL